MRPRLTLLAVLFVANSLCVSAPPHEGGSQTLSLCDLVDRWKDHHGQTVRVGAFLAVNPEMRWLYDPDCKNGEALTDVEIREDNSDEFKQLFRILAKGKRAWVVLEGVFHGPETHRNVDPNLPPAIRERLEKTPKRYGHMDAFGSMIEVSRVIEVKESADRPKE